MRMIPMRHVDRRLALIRSQDKVATIGRTVGKWAALAGLGFVGWKATSLIIGAALSLGSLVVPAACMIGGWYVYKRLSRS